MKLSARNVFKGRITEVHVGPTTTRVKIQVAPGVVVTASITTEAAQELDLKVGDEASAIIKASSVIIGKEHLP
jgi:molybdopterin-binding protein